jgi:heptosyltransferase-2
VKEKRDRSEPGGSLVLQTSFLGDTVLTTPLIACLARSSAVDVVTTPASANVLQNHPAIRDVLVYDKRRGDSGVAGFLRTAARLRARRYGAAYLAQGSVRSGALALAARIPERVGFSSSAGRGFYTRRVPFIENAHHAARLLSLATSIDEPEGGTSAIRPRLYPGDRERVAVDSLLAHAGLSGEPLIALAPGSVWATKRWPEYPRLAALMDDGRPIVIGSDDDRLLAAEIVAASHGRAIDATGQLSLLASAELIGRCRVLVTNDSAPLHLASAMNTPTVAIFGPTVPEFGFGPLAERHRVVGHAALACRPCDRHGPRACPLRHWRCMREITPESIAATVRELLAH